MSEYPNIRVSECPNTTDLTPTPLGFDRDAASIDRSIDRSRAWVVFFRRARVRKEYPVDVAPAPRWSASRDSRSTTTTVCDDAGGRTPRIDTDERTRVYYTRTRVFVFVFVRRDGGGRRGR